MIVKYSGIKPSRVIHLLFPNLLIECSKLIVGALNSGLAVRVVQVLPCFL